VLIKFSKVLELCFSSVWTIYNMFRWFVSAW